MRRAAFLPVVLPWCLMLAGPRQSLAQKTAAAVPEKVIAIRAANLIDGVSDKVRHNVLIVVRGNRIESVSEGGTPPAGATNIAFGAGATALPGLIDTHTHIFLQGEDPAEGGY